MSEKALKHLLQMGFVFSFRRTQHFQIKDWITDRRGGKKIADVTVSVVTCCRPFQLEPYLEYSGFKSLEEWEAEIRRLNRGKNFTSGYVHKIELRNVDGSGR